MSPGDHDTKNEGIDHRNGDVLIPIPDNFVLIGIPLFSLYETYFDGVNNKTHHTSRQ